MVIEATYKDGTTKEISDYTIIDGNTLKANQKQITISYGEKTITQDITVTSNALTEIKVTKAPNKTQYIVGQDFDKTGMIITGTYQDKSTQEILRKKNNSINNSRRKNNYININNQSSF